MSAVAEQIPSMLQGMTQQVPELRLPNQGDLQINGISHPVYGLGKRIGTDHIRRLVFNSTRRPFVSWLSRDDSERYAVVFDGQYIRVFGLDGREYFVQVAENTLGYLNCERPSLDLFSLTLADTTLILNRTVTPAMEADTSDALDHVAIVWVRSGNYGQTYTVNVGGTDYSYTTPTGSGGAGDVAYLSTANIAVELANAIGTGPGGAYTVTHVTGESQFTVEKTAGGTFDISVKDTVGGGSLSVVYNQAPSFADLPPSAPAGYLCKILGNASDSADDYWVQFDPDRDVEETGTLRGEWVETIAPSTAYAIDAATMPHQLARLQDDESGTVTGQPFAVYFRFDEVEWEDRIVGDETTSPDPSFIGEPIKTLFLHQDRLGFLFKGTVVASKTGDYFNFWRGSVTQVLDDDPLDFDIAPGRLAEDRVLNLSHAVSFSEQLLLIGDRAQIVVPSDQPLTPKTFQAKLSQSFEASEDCPPLTVNGSAIIPFTDGVSTGVREMFVSGTTGNTNESTLLSRHIPRLIEGQPLGMSVCPAESTLIVSSDGDLSKLYIFRWSDENGTRVQASWGIWEFGEGVLAHGVIGATLWLIVLRPEGPCLESMELRAWNQTEYTPFPFLVDRKVAIGTARMRPNGHPPIGGNPGQGPGNPPSDGGDGGDGGDPLPPTRPHGPIDPVLGDTGKFGPDVTRPEIDGSVDIYRDLAGGRTRDFHEWSRQPIVVTGNVELPYHKIIGGYQDMAADLLDLSGDDQIISILAGDDPGDGADGEIGGPDSGDHRERGTIEYDESIGYSIVTLPWSPRLATVVIRADTMQQLQWIPGPAWNQLVIYGDLTAVPLYAGFLFEFRYRFGPAVILKPSKTGGASVIRSGRLQVHRWRVVYNPSGAFNLETWLDDRVVRSKRVTVRTLGDRIINEPQEGTADTLVLAKASRARVDIVCRTYWPAWFISAEWVGEYHRDSKLL